MGYNGYGQLGDGFGSDSATPEQIVPIPQPVLAVPMFMTGSAFKAVTKIAAGVFCSLYVKSDGSLWAGGYNGNGQLGGTFNTAIAPEQIISSGVRAVAIDAFFYSASTTPHCHTLILMTDGSLWAAGNDGFGQLGDGRLTTTNRFEQIVSGNVAGIAAGDFHSLFFKTDGSLWTMGANSSGQLGDGTLNNTNAPEEIVASSVVAIAAGGSHSLFLKSDGSLWAMGNNSYGQLGDGTLFNTNRPEQIVASNVVAVAAGSSHSLFLKSDGSLWAMGWNAYGQLGDGTTNNVIVPKEIISSGVIAVAAGLAHTLFVKSDRSLWTMGANNSGQLGDSTTSRSKMPEEIVSSGVVAIAAGNAHSLFIKSDGSLWGMGDNSYNQLGNGSGGSLNPQQLTSGVSNLFVQATCQFGGTYYLLSSTNLTRPISQWTTLLTNSIIFRGSNNFSAPLVIPSSGKQFYILHSQ